MWPACPPPDCDLYECECWSAPELKCPTKYHNLRFKENWKACLCVPVCDRGDWSDALKAINRESIIAAKNEDFDGIKDTAIQMGLIEE